MTMEVAVALRRGVDYTVSRTGSAFMAVFLLLDFLFAGVPSILVDTTAAVSNLFATSMAALIGLILSMTVTVVAFRMFAAYDLAGPENRYDTRRIGAATVNMVVGALVAAILIGIGFILIIPGLFLLVSLLFWPAFVAIEDQDFMDAFRHSWRMTAGHRWRVLLLALGILLVLVMIGAVTALFTFVTPGRLVPAFIVSAANAFTTVFSIAAVTDAYTQLAE